MRKIIELEEAIATLNPEEQIRAHRVLDHKGALIFMGQVEEHSYYDHEGMTKDQAHLLKLAKLSEDEFELALTALNQIKSHPIIFEMFSDYEFHRLDCLVNFNVNRALEFLNNDIIKEWVQNFRSLSTLTQFPLSKVKTLISHPNIKQIITDVRELKFILYSNDKMFNNLLKAFDEEVFVKAFFNNDNSIYDILRSHESYNFNKVIEFLTLHPDIVSNLDGYSKFEKVEFLSNLSNENFNKFKEFFKNIDGCEYFNEYYYYFESLLELSDNQWKNTLKAFEVKEFITFIKRGNTRIDLNIDLICKLPDEQFNLVLQIFIKPGVMEYINHKEFNSSGDEIGRLKDIISENNLIKANILEIQEIRSFIDNSQHKLELIYRLVHNSDINEHITKIIKILSIKELNLFISGDQSEMEFIFNLPDDKFNVALSILQKPGVIEYIGSWNRHNILKDIISNDELIKAINILEIQEIRAFIDGSRSMLKFIFNLAYKTNSDIINDISKIINPYQVIEQNKLTCDFNEKITKIIIIFNLENSRNFIKGYDYQEKLEFLINLSNDQLTKSLKILSIKEFNLFIGSDQSEMEFILNLSGNQFNYALEALQKIGVVEYIGSWDRHNKLKDIISDDNFIKINILEIQEVRSFIDGNKSTLEFIYNLAYKLNYDIIENKSDFNNKITKIIKILSIKELNSFINNSQNNVEFLLNLSNEQITKSIKNLSIKEFSLFIRSDQSEMEFILNLPDSQLNSALDLLQKPGVINYIGNGNRIAKLKTIIELPENEYKLVIKTLKYPKVVDNLNKNAVDFKDLKHLINLPEKEYSEAIAVMNNAFCILSRANENTSSEGTKEASDWLIDSAIMHNTAEKFLRYMNGFTKTIEINIAKLSNPYSCKSISLQDNKLIQIIKDTAANHAFELPISIAALANLDNVNNRVNFYDQSSIYHYDKNSKLVPAAGVYSNGSTSVATKNKEDNQIKSTFVHELEHQSMSLVFNNKANPYKEEDLKGKLEFEEIILKTLSKLHKHFIPEANISNDIGSILESLTKVKASNKVEQNIIETFTALVSEDTIYQTEDYHAEFVVRYPDIIAENGEIPPILREIFQDLENTFKDNITPALREYIAMHSKKDMLIMNNYAYSETALTHSSEYDLLSTKNPTAKQLELLKQFNEIKEIIESDNQFLFYKKFKEISDETVKKAVLSEAISHGSDFMSLTTLFSIDDKEFLGPQLVMASELNKNDIASELSFFVNNPYYLSKAAEISACQDNLELSQKLIKTIDNEWFSSRAIEYGEQVQEASDISSICINFDYKEPVSGKCEALEHLCSY